MFAGRSPRLIALGSLVTALVLSAGWGCVEQVEDPVIAVAIGTIDVVTLAERTLQEQGRRVRLIGGQGQWFLEDDDARAKAFGAIEGIIGVVGHESSERTLAVAAHYSESGLPLLIPTGTNPALSRLGPGIFMLSPTDSVQGVVLARAAQQMGAERVALLYSNDQYGLGLREALLRDLPSRGIEVVEQVEVYNRADVAARTEAMLGRSMPDLILVAGRAREAGLAARTALRVAPDVRLLASDGAFVPSSLATHGGEAMDNIVLTVQWHHLLDDPIARGFSSRFESLTGRWPIATDALVYDGIMLLLAAYDEVGPDRRAIAGYLSSLGAERPPYYGVTGRVAFGTQASRAFYLVTFQDGELQPLSLP